MTEWISSCVELVDEAAFTLENVRRPLRLYKQLRQDLDDWMGAQLPLVAREIGRDVEDASLPLLESCGVFLLGFPDEMESQLQFLVRFAMGSLYYDPHFPAVSHVVVSPVLSDSDLTRLDQLEDAVVAQRVDAVVHFVSARWLLDSLRCRRIEPEEMYPVEIEDSDAPAEHPPPQAAPTDGADAPVEARDEALETSFTDAPELTEDAVTAADAGADAAATTSAGKLFQGLGFLLLCQNPDEPVAVRSTVREIQSKTGALAIALDVRDVGLVDPAQFDFVTHVVIGSGIEVAENEMDALRERFAAFYASNNQSDGHDADTTQEEQRRRRRQQRRRRGGLKVVSDLWVRCCLEANCMLSQQSHELFALTYQASRSMFPVPLPLVCFRDVVASTSVYVGVDRVVVMELLRLAGATVTSKLSKRNTHLICLHPMGMKYDKAKQWGLCVVTARWVVQSVIHGELLDASLPEFQLADDTDNTTKS
ncbi:hypothetical protein PINS_up019100 [Pythium insidiosum]|nr:hypothetical protein PINS_up019100 [Pythium insidiosum]